jgi:hypothetical protein
MAEQFRSTVSLDPVVGALAQKVGEIEKRTFSNLVEVALAEYCEKRRVDPQAAQLIEAAGQIGFPEALKALHRAARRKAAA